MRIALCFSGQPREMKAAYDFSILKNIIQPNNITDIFVHTWWRPEWSNNVPYTDTTGRNPTYFDKNSIQIIKDLYKPLKMEVEDDGIYKEYIKSYFFDDDKWIANCKTAQHVRYPQALSVYKANKLKNDYEKEQGFEYDVVIKMRFDFNIKESLIINNFDVSKYFYIPTSYPQRRLGIVPVGPDWCGVNDEFAIGNKKNMDIYCDIANRVKETSSRHPESGGEGFLGYYLVDNDVPLYFAWIDRKDICTCSQLRCYNGFCG